MNIISNTCVGGYLMKTFIGQPYSNPFVWSYVDIDDFIKLINEYDTINWNNYRIIQSKISNKLYDVLVDDKILIQYWHYNLDENCKTVTVKNNNVFYYDIKTYINDTYKKRITRMMETNDPPIFIIADTYKRPYTNRDVIEKMKNIKTNYPVLFFNNDLININENNCKMAEHIFNSKEFARWKHQ